MLDTGLHITSVKLEVLLSVCLNGMALSMIQRDLISKNLFNINRKMEVSRDLKIAKKPMVMIQQYLRNVIFSSPPPSNKPLTRKMLINFNAK